MKVWVLTREVNDYNQYGEYLEACFKEKPAIEQLSTITGLTKTYWERNPIGGREGDESVWYNLHEVKYGEEF